MGREAQELLNHPTLQLFFKAAEDEFREMALESPPEEWTSEGMVSMKYQMEGIKQLKQTLETFVLNGKLVFNAEKGEAEDKT